MVVLAAAHLDHDPAHNRLRNLRALCQRCHMKHDKAHHQAQRWITCRRRQALGDDATGEYPCSAIANLYYATLGGNECRLANTSSRHSISSSL
jgi:hypothetical protein